MKKLSLSTLILFLCFNSIAQNIVGLNVGWLNFNMYNFTRDPHITLGFEAKSSITPSLDYIHFLNENKSVKINCSYFAKNFSSRGGTNFLGGGSHQKINYTTSWLNTSILSLKYTSYKKFKFYIGGGAQFSFLLDANKKGLYSSTNNYNKQTYSSYIESSAKKDLKSFDLRALLDFGVNMPLNKYFLLSIDNQISNGLRHLGNNSIGNVGYMNSLDYVIQCGINYIIKTKTQSTSTN